MKTRRPIVWGAFAFLLSLLFVPLSARAQGRGMHSVLRAPRVADRHGAHVSAAPRRAGRRAFARPADHFCNGFGVGSGETLQQLLNPAPGLGFDYAYLTAIDSDLGVKAAIDPETEWRLGVAERLLRNSGCATAAYYPFGGGEYIVPAGSESGAQSQEPPQIIVLQQPAQSSPEGSASPTGQQPSTPIPDVSNFTLVLQNGEKIEAIAVTRFGDRMVYITADGARHTIAASQLDQAATKRVNQDSGTPLTL